MCLLMCVRLETFSLALHLIASALRVNRTVPVGGFLDISTVVKDKQTKSSVINVLVSTGLFSLARVFGRASE